MTSRNYSSILYVDLTNPLEYDCVSTCSRFISFDVLPNKGNPSPVNLSFRCDA